MSCWIVLVRFECLNRLIDVSELTVVHLKRPSHTIGVTDGISATDNIIDHVMRVLSI